MSEAICSLFILVFVGSSLHATTSMPSTKVRAIGLKVTAANSRNQLSWLKPTEFG